MAITSITIEEEYKKNTGITPKDLEILREWLQTQPHLPAEHINDLDLILALHSCNNSLSVTKEVIDLHYTLKTHLDMFFGNRVMDSKMEHLLNVILCTSLPARSKEGYACVYFRFIDSDPKKFSVLEMYRAVLMIMELWQNEEGTGPGVIFIVDFTQMQLQHIVSLDLQAVQQFFYFLQEAMLVKFKGMHMINAPSFVDVFMSVLKPFLRKEILAAMTIHTAESTTIEQYFPIECLPKESGGNYKTINELKDLVIEKLRANEDFFKQEKLKRVVEAKRPGKPKSITDYFGGVEGSFKKLDVF